jgi:hypothetical protein
MTPPVVPETPDAHVGIVESKPVSITDAAVGSLLVPGLGQLLQRRYLTAALHAASVGAYLISAYKYGGRGWMLGALVFNLWSVLDAMWWSRGSGQDDDDDGH